MNIQTCPRPLVSSLVSAFIVVTCLCAASINAADPLVRTSVNKANEIIDLALAAHGGKERLAGIKSIAQERTIVNYATQQSFLPDPPWDQSIQSDTTAYDLEHGLYVNRNSGAAGGFEFNTQLVTRREGGDSWQVDYHAGTVAKVAEPDINTSSGPFVRVNAPLLLRQLDERRQTSHWLGVAEVDGRPHDVVTLVMAVGPGLSLFFDQDTHMLNRMERMLVPLGLVSYRFGDYAVVDGVPVNRSLDLFLDDEPNLELRVSSTKLDVPIEPYAAIPETLKTVADIKPDEFGLQEIDEGVFLVGGNGTYGLLVEMEDHIVALGGTQGVAQRITEVRKRIPDKPVRYGVLTHHHNDHIVGAAEYAKEGATIVTFRENETVVTAAARENPARLEFVEDHLTLGDGKRVIELYDIGPTPHAQHMLIAWLPRERIIFEGDHFIQPFTGPIVPAVSATRAFADALAKRGLGVERIVGEHSPRVATASDLAEAVRQQPAMMADAR